MKYKYILSMKLTMNLNQIPKTCQMFGYAYSWHDNALNSQSSIWLKIYLGNLLDNSSEIFNRYFVICICTSEVFDNYVFSK